MIQSVFILSDTGEVLIEKHWRHTSPRSLVDVFIAHTSQVASPKDVSPVITTAKNYLINVYRGKLFLLAVVSAEVAPLLVIEFLHRVVDVFIEYFGSVSEYIIKENFTTVYQLLEEMLDNGYPLLTESNALKELIAPPSFTSKIAAAVTGSSSVSETLPDGAVSNLHWRKKGVRYSKNEIYFDISEEVDCIIGRDGRPVVTDVFGEIRVKCHLSGMPDMLMTLVDPSVIEDCSFHPCVRYARFDKDKVISFVPPDGSFTLMNYKVLTANTNYNNSGNSYSKNSTQASFAAPIYCTPQLSYDDQGGRIEVMVGSKSMVTTGPTAKSKLSGRESVLEDVVVVVPLPSCVQSSDLSTNIGTVFCDEATKVCTWTIGRLPKLTTPKLTGKFTFAPSGSTKTSHVDGVDSPDTGNASDEEGGSINKTPVVVKGGGPNGSLTAELYFRVPSTTMSGIQIDSLSSVNETYKFEKGVRSHLRAGRYHIRV